MPHRRLVLALALTIALAILAAIVLLVPDRSFGTPISAVQAAPPPPAYSGPAAELVRAREYQAIGDAVKADAAASTARWYEWAAAHPPAPPPPLKPAQRPTSSPSSAPADASPVPRGSGDAAEAIGRYFGDIYDQAWGVTGCESGHDPGAISPGGGNWGLFQINRAAHQADFEAYTGHPWADVLNADLNAMYARKLYDGSGWGPWSCAWAA